MGRSGPCDGRFWSGWTEAPCLDEKGRADLHVPESWEHTGLQTRLHDHRGQDHQLVVIESCDPWLPGNRDNGGFEAGQHMA